MSDANEGQKPDATTDHANASEAAKPDVTKSEATVADKAGDEGAAAKGSTDKGVGEPKASESDTEKKSTSEKSDTEKKSASEKSDTEKKSASDASAAVKVTGTGAAGKMVADAHQTAAAAMRKAARVKPTDSETPDADVVVVDASSLGEDKSDGADADAPKRKVRRSRTVEAPVEAPAEAASADDDGEPRKKRRRRRRKDGPRDKDEGRDKKAGAVLQTESRRVYRQDVPGSDPGQATRGRRPPEEPKKKDVNEQDKITLLLHPAPKAGAHRAASKKKKDRPKTAKEALRAKTKQPKKASKAGKQDAASVDAAWVKVDMAGAEDAAAQAGDAGEALVKAWLDGGNAAAIAVVAQAEGLGGKVRKAARRALNVLKSRGVDIPEIEADAPSAEEGPEPFVAKYIPPDASGTSFLSISQRQKGGRYHVADVLFRSGIGVIHATTARLAGKHIRDWQKRIEEQFGTKPVDVPLEWARHQIAEARKRNDESKQIVPLGYDSCAPMIGPAPETEPAHPLADLDASEASKEDVEKATLGSDALHTEPEFRTWMPDRNALDELLRKVGERVGSEEGAQDPGVVDEALKVEVTAATDRFFAPELRVELAERMRGAAISMRARVGDDAATRVLRIAKAVKEAGLITSPPSEIPFLVSFFQKAVAMMVRQNQGQLRVPIPTGAVPAQADAPPQAEAT